LTSDSEPLAVTVKGKARGRAKKPAKTAVAASDDEDADAGSEAAEEAGVALDASTAQRLNAAVRADTALYTKILRYEVRWCSVFSLFMSAAR